MTQGVTQGNKICCIVFFCNCFSNIRRVWYYCDR